MKQSILSMLERYAGLFPNEQREIYTITERVKAAAQTGLLYDTNANFHVTASAILVSADEKRIAAITHSKEHKLLQPGGHVEKGETLSEAARRELREETGFRSFVLNHWHIRNGCPIDVDLHSARCGAGVAEHLDSRFLFRARSHLDLAGTEAIWVPVSRVVEGSVLPNIERIARKAISLQLISGSGL